MFWVFMPLGWIVAVTLAWTTLPGSVEAQFITRWVDANGVLTFSTSSPPPGVKYEPVAMPSWRGADKKPAAAVPESGTEGAAAPADRKSAAEPAKASGPAQVQIQEQATTSLGETRWLLAGKVKNGGGGAADGVAIRISVLEDGQGNPCLEDRGTVSPSTLQPGDTGTFELTYDSPCFFGSPRIDIVAEWQK